MHQSNTCRRVEVQRMVNPDLLLIGVSEENSFSIIWNFIIKIDAYEPESTHKQS